MRKWWGIWGAGVVVAMTWACSGEPETAPPVVDEAPAVEAPPEEAAPPEAPPEEEQAPPTESAPPAEDDSASLPPGTPPGAPPDTAPPPPALMDPWPQDALVNYTQRFGVGRPQGVAVDDAFNVWLLEGNRIGVLRPGATQPLWVSGIGQAGRGFTSSVICGGSAGRAYVGYLEKDLPNAWREAYTDPVYTEGDLDAVMLTPEGTIALEEHVHRNYRKDKNTGKLSWNAPINIGIRNSNDWHYDEDRAVFSCVKVTRGRDRGEVYIGTNHGVSRIKGLYYNSHRHPVWMAGSSQRAGYTYSLGIAQDGDVLIANDWTFGIVSPNPDLGLWDAMTPKTLNPMKVESSFLPEVNTLEEFDYWRGFQQTKDGRYYLGSRTLGLWELKIRSAGDRAQQGLAVTGLPTPRVSALAATDDGSLFVGTYDQGLWRMDADKRLTRVLTLQGQQVKQLLYDPTATPAMLYVVTETGLTVYRGY